MHWQVNENLNVIMAAIYAKREEKQIRKKVLSTNPEMQTEES